MVRLALPFLTLLIARRKELRNRVNGRRLARYMNKALSMGEERIECRKGSFISFHLSGAATLLSSTKKEK
jgi:hypothetical protein